MNKYIKIILLSLALTQGVVPSYGGFWTGVVVGSSSVNSNQCEEINIDTCFTPSQDCIKPLIKALGNAKESIYVQAYSFTNNDLAMALIEAKGRGVDVRVYIDKSRVKEKHCKIHKLIEAKIPVIIQKSKHIAHNKIMIIDDEMVITGSFNWTQNATKNEENLNFIKSKDSVKVYLDNWKEIVRK